MSEEPMVESEERGQYISPEEYLGHIAYAYASSPADSPEESIAKALLEVACARLNADPQVVVNQALSVMPGGRMLPPWPAGTGAPIAPVVELPTKPR